MPSTAENPVRRQRGRAGFADVLRDVAAGGEPGGSDIYTIRTGDTMYRIARARLLASGQRAAPAEIRRFAADVARKNGLSNWNRIYAGRKLDVSPVAPPAARWPLPQRLSEPARGALSQWAANEMLPASHATAFHTTDVQPEIVDQIVDTEEPSDSDSNIAALDTVATANRLLTPVSAETDARGVKLYEENAAVTKNCSANPLSDIAYKGVVGKLLDAVPLDSSTRTTLQQANAVASNSMTGRSLAAMVGLSNPVFALAGFFWGLFSARQISVAGAAEQPATARCVAQEQANVPETR